MQSVRGPSGESTVRGSNRTFSLYTSWLAEARDQAGELGPAVELAQDGCRLNEAMASSYSDEHVRGPVRRIRRNGVEIGRYAVD